MGWAQSRRSRVALAIVVLATLGIVASVVTVPGWSARAENYPTWNDVQKAKQNAKTKAIEVANIRTLLSGLQAKAAALGQQSIAAAAAYSVAATKLRTAESTYTGLVRQSTAAQTRATAARQQAGSVATQLYRSGDPTVALWLSGDTSSSLLYRLGALSQISGSSAAILQQAVADQRIATALGAQAKVAARIRTELAAQAKSLEVAARNAQAAADAEVASTAATSATLTAQLSSLQSTYKAENAGYEQGVKAKEAAAARGETGSAGTLSSVSPGPNSLSPDGARAYAAGRMSAFGWNSSQNTCLGWLWYRESGWRWDAYNTSSGAYGIAQSLPASKYASAGADWVTSSKTQIEWGLGYIQYRYGSPCSAWDHETEYSWY